MAATPLRRPAFAGRFYPDDPLVLRSEVQTYLSLESRTEQIPALACLVPHAGYVYSGHVAGAVFARIEIPELCVLLGPNHTGKGCPLSIMSQGAWQTPLGAVDIENHFATALIQRFPLLEEDSTAHISEHAIEVEMPFLQVRQPKVCFVPIAIGTQTFEVLKSLGVALAEVIAEQTQPILVIASSDMNHYESDGVTRVKDGAAIGPILALDPQALYTAVIENNSSMCGFAPAIVMLTAARKLGASSGELVKYATSGDVSGDRQHVVGYAGIAIY